jgi:hypothetical protein
MSEKELEQELRAISYMLSRKAPKEHRLRTPGCPPLSRILEMPDRLFSADMGHLDSCAYCQRMLSIGMGPILPMYGETESSESASGEGRAGVQSSEETVRVEKRLLLSLTPEQMARIVQAVKIYFQPWRPLPWKVQESSGDIFEPRQSTGNDKPSLGVDKTPSDPKGN